MDSEKPGTCDKTVSIEDKLPRKCLAHIFSYLNVRQLIGIERVCKRWRDLSRKRWEETKILDFTDLVPEIDKQLSVEKKHFIQVLSKCGNHLNSLLVEVGWGIITMDEVLQLIGDYCVNLQHLSLDLIWKELEILPESFLKVLKNLKSLTIFGDVEPIHMGVFLREAENLEKFVMRRFSELVTQNEPFDHLTRKCTHIELHTYDASEYAYARVLSDLAKLGIFKRGAIAPSMNTTIRVLVLAGGEGCDYDRISNVSLNEVLQHLPNLKILKMEIFPNFLPSALLPSSNTLEEFQVPNHFFCWGLKDRWPLFPNLRILTAKFDGPTTGDLFADLLAKCPNLEELDISGSNLRSDEFGRLINFPRLRRLAVNDCSKMSSQCLKFISAHMNTKLEVFECAKNTWKEDELLELVRQCGNLTELKADLSYEEKFIEEASKIIESNPKRKLLRFYNLPWCASQEEDDAKCRFVDYSKIQEYKTEAGRLLLKVFSL